MFAYNPRKKSPEELEKSMVGDDRWDILRIILKELSLADGECPKQHWVFVGPRGIGKSHLLTLLHHKVKASPELNNLWMPILFPEELPMAKDLSGFLERAVREILLESGPERNTLHDKLRLKIEEIRKVPPSKRSDYLFSIITWIHRATRKFILLMVENLQKLLGKKFSFIDQKKLKAYLQTSDAVLLIGSATTVFDALHDSGKPFDNFFHIHRLEDLNFEDMKTLTADILSSGGQDSSREQDSSCGQHSSTGQHGLTRKVLDREREARLRALYSFTGGNPRMAVILADILKSDICGEMLTLMDQILDGLTPYFEGIFGDVPAHLAEIINILSAAYDPAQSPKEIAERLGLPQTTVRNYLKQLRENGCVRVAFSKGKSHYYCLSEYLYRIWYQMRDNAHREETRWLIELLLMLYSPASIIERRKGPGECEAGNGGNSFYSSPIDKEADFTGGNPDYDKFVECYVESTPKGDREGIEEWEKQEIEKAVSLFNSKRYDEAVKYCKGILEINPDSGAAAYIWGECLRAQGRLDEAIELYKKISKINPNSEGIYGACGDCLRAHGQYGEAIELYKKTLEINFNSERAYRTWAYTLKEMEHYDMAIAIIEEHLLSSNDYPVIYLYGICLLELDRYEEALKQFDSLVDVYSYRPIVYLLSGRALEKMGNQMGALLSYIKHIRFSSQDSFIDLDFKDSYEEHILPMLEVLKSKSENYIKQFYLPGEDQKLTRDQLSILLILMDKYDIMSEHIRTIIADGIGESDREGEQTKEGE
ncbi:MAG: tetratricopeptide repeat protein, partial [Thermoproteota archaeon]|nr:tetratricopeptide repeat protein [Thermoproteota archaeon]